MLSRTPLRPRAASAALVGLCLALTACSGGSGTPAATGSSSPAAGSSAPASPPAAAGGTPSGAASPTGATPTDSASASPGTASASPSGSAAPDGSSAGGQTAELPRGGTSIFPEHFVVMHYGTAGSGALGVLGERPPEQAARRLQQVADTWEGPIDREVLPAFELITTVASSRPGRDGTYSTTLDVDTVKRYLAAARKHKMLLVLDFQPGRASFLEQVKKYEEVLREPEVGVALDPEWKLTATQRPLRQIGTSKAAPINDVSEYLADIVRENDLPEKIFMIHQFKVYQLPDRDKIADREGLATVLHVDGFGTQKEKFFTYDVLASRDKQFVNGFKLFYDEDTDLLTPSEVARIKPRPQLVSYQ